jgi:hypothetical protein
VQATPPRVESKPPSRGVRRIPRNSFLYARVVPLALVVMTVLLALIVVVAAAFIFGFFKY